MDRAVAKRRLLEALLGGSTSSLEKGIWEITVAELHAGSCKYRRALVEALDGSAIMSTAQRVDLLQKFFQLSQRGSTEAMCFVGILLCFHSHREEDAGLAKEGARFLLSAYHQKCNLATLLLALCYECGRGVKLSTDSALQCYTVAANHGYQLAQILHQECFQEVEAEAAGLQRPAAATQDALRSINSASFARPNTTPSLHPTLSLPARGASPSLLAQSPPPPPPPTQAPQAGLQQQLQLQVPNEVNLEEQVSGAKTRLSFAMKNGDAADLASALTWAAEVGNRGSGQLTEDIMAAKHMLEHLQDPQAAGKHVNGNAGFTLANGDTSGSVSPIANGETAPSQGPREAIVSGTVITEITAPSEEVFHQSLEDMLNDLELQTTAQKHKPRSVSSSPKSDVQQSSTEGGKSADLHEGSESSVPSSLQNGITIPPAASASSAPVNISSGLSSSAPKERNAADPWGKMPGSMDKVDWSMPAKAFTGPQQRLSQSRPASPALSHASTASMKPQPVAAANAAKHGDISVHAAALQAANGTQLDAAEARRQLLARDAGANRQVHGMDQGGGRYELQHISKTASLGSDAASDADGTPPVLAALQRWSTGSSSQQDFDIIMACPALAPEVKQAMADPNPQTREILVSYVQQTLGAQPSQQAQQALRAPSPRPASPAISCTTSPAMAMGSHTGIEAPVTSLPPDDLSHQLSSAALWSSRQAVPQPGHVAGVPGSAAGAPKHMTQQAARQLLAQFGELGGQGGMAPPSDFTSRNLSTDAGADPEAVAEYMRLLTSAKAAGGHQHPGLTQQEAALQARLLLQQQQQQQQQQKAQQYQQALQQQQQQQAAAANLLRAGGVRGGINPAALSQLPGAAGLTPAQQQALLQTIAAQQNSAVNHPGLRANPALSQLHLQQQQQQQQQQQRLASMRGLGYAGGLNNPGGLHDLTGSLAAVRPNDRPWMNGAYGGGHMGGLGGRANGPRPSMPLHAGYMGGRDSFGRSHMPDASDQAGLRGAQLLGSGAAFPPRPSLVPTPPAMHQRAAHLPQASGLLSHLGPAAVPSFNLNPGNLAAGLTGGAQQLPLLSPNLGSQGVNIPGQGLSNMASGGWSQTSAGFGGGLPRTGEYGGHALSDGVASGLMGGSGGSNGHLSSLLGGMDRQPETSNLTTSLPQGGSLQHALSLGSQAPPPPIRTEVNPSASGSYSLFTGSRLPLDRALTPVGGSSPAVGGPMSHAGSQNLGTKAFDIGQQTPTDQDIRTSVDFGVSNYTDSPSSSILAANQDVSAFSRAFEAAGQTKPFEMPQAQRTASAAPSGWSTASIDPPAQPAQSPFGPMSGLETGTGLLKRPPRGPIGPMPAPIAPARGGSRFGAPGSRLPTHSSF